MQYRDSSIGTHFVRGVAANVDSSHGVKLSEAFGAGSSVSTGGLVEPIGDDANISLRVRPVGSGLLILGSTLAAVQIGSDSTLSTTALSAVQKYLIQYTEPSLSSGPASSFVTITVPNADTAANFVFNPVANNTGMGPIQVTCSTTGQVSVLYASGNAAALTGNTNTARILMFRY